MRAVKRTIGLILIAMCSILALWYYLNPIFCPQPLPLNNATIVFSSHPLTDFKLVDIYGRPFTPDNLRGHWTLMFFGYAECPNICPSTLTILRDTWNHFDIQKPAKFIFVSINPNHDSAASLKTFLARFHPDFIGVTGTEPAVKQLSNQLNVFAQRSEESSAQDKQVIIDHTAALMLINPQGKLQAIFTPPLDPQALAQDLVTITKARPAVLKGKSN